MPKSSLHLHSTILAIVYIIYTLLKTIKGTLVRNVISGLPYMLHLRILYASRRLFRLHNTTWLHDLYGEDNASTYRFASIPPYQDWIYRFAKTCTIFALLTYKLMLPHSFTNNLPDLPYRSHTSDNNVSYS